MKPDPIWCGTPDFINNSKSSMDDKIEYKTVYKISQLGFDLCICT